MGEVSVAVARSTALVVSAGEVSAVALVGAVSMAVVFVAEV